MLTDCYDELWLDRINSSDQVPAGLSRLYLLIDGVFVPGLHRLINAALAGPDALTLLFEKLPCCGDEARAVSPFLISYEPANQRLQKLLGKCSGWPMISAIETEETHSELSERLAAWCIIEADGQRFNFRFPDTRRLPDIFDVLTTLQKAELAGPAIRWSYMERNGKWGELAVPAKRSAIADRPVLNDKQFDQLVSNSEADEIILRLQDRGYNFRGRYSQTYSIVAAALRTPRAVGLDTSARLSWCESCLADGEVMNESQSASQFAKWQSASETKYPAN